MSKLLSPGPLEKLRLDLTTNCNLRCVYCALSQSTWQGADMPADVSRAAITAVTRMARLHPIDEVHINGHGETTFLEGWEKICQSLLDENLPLLITTNLAKQYSNPEFEVLARMNVIMVSIDSCDPDLLRRMRRKVDVRQIVMNIQMIRTTALRLGLAPPSFNFSCGLYDQNSLLIEDFARFAVTLGINIVGFWNLATWHHEQLPYENTDVPESDRAYPLDNLSPEELRPRLEAIQRAISILNANGVSVEINGNFIETLSRQCEPSSEPAPLDGIELPVGTTRDCIDPWIYAELEANGDVKPCCAHSAIGNLRRAELTEILNDEPVRRLRASLLSGATDKYCTECPLRPPVKPEALQERVRVLLEERATQEHVLNGKPHMPASAGPKVASLLNSALKHLRADRATTAWVQVSQALAIDPGINVASNAGEDMIRNHISLILSHTQSPGTLTWLAAICREIGDRQTDVALLRQYLVLAPLASDRAHVLSFIASQTSMASQTPPKPSVIAALKQNWMMLRGKVRLRTRLRLFFDKF
jgi:MoaA/NifB/PqqE/SkfB family radical SAM enzyme